MNTNLMETVGSHVGRHVGVGAIFGEPVSLGDRILIPVARVGFGFGSGSSVRAHEPQQGGGGGGGNRPLGVFEVSQTGTRFVPVRTRPGPLVLFGLGLFVGWSLASRLRPDFPP